MATDRKLGIIRKMGIEHDAVVDVLTDARNDYEHDYFLPSPKNIRAHLHAAQLWLEHSYVKHEFPPVGFFDLPLLSISSGSRRPSGSYIGDASFGRPRRVTYFDANAGLVLTLGSDGTERSTELGSLDVKGVLQIEGPLICKMIADGCGAAVNSASLADLLDRYRSWVRSWLSH